MDIVEEIRSDPEKGARRLEAEFRAGLHTLARRLCRDNGDAAELVNRTFAEVISNIDSYAEQSAFFAWMSKILVNLNANDIRRKTNGILVYPGEVPDIPDERSENDIYREVDASFVRDAIEKLPEEEREVLLLHYYADIPIVKMAKILAVPVGTVKSRLHYARNALAAKLGVAAKKPGGKAVLLALLLFGLTALGVGARLAVVRLLSSPSVAVEQQADNSKDAGQAETYDLHFSTSSNMPQSPSGVAGSPQRGAEEGADFSQGENMNMSKTTRAAAMLAAATVASVATIPETAGADPPSANDITAYSGGFTLDTRPSPQVVAAPIESFSTMPLAFVITIR